MLADELARHLRHRILSGERLAGSSVGETEIANEYGVARTTARSALDRLVADGVLVRQAHASLRVRSVPQEELSEILDLLEMLESLAIDRLVVVNPDLRDVREASAGNLHHLLDAVVCAMNSERLSRFHRQTTFELLLGLAPQERAAPLAALREDNSARERLVLALFQAAPTEARLALSDLWALRRRSATWTAATASDDSPRPPESGSATERRRGLPLER